jgi:hypothetical protein
VTVRTPDELREALGSATAGTVIAVADGPYPGEFRAASAGTAQRPIWLCGSRRAVLGNVTPQGRYTLHVDHASHWRIQGLTVSGGRKGVMVDASHHVVLEGLLVTGSGDEAIHLRDGSTDNVVRGNVVRDTGRRKPKFGEGVYVGTAESNWCAISDCHPDRSDRNLVEGNDIAGVSAEGIDIKEGTHAGVVRDNLLSGAAATAADSAVDVKGNGWKVIGNTVVDVPQDGFQVHEITDGSGDANVFVANTGHGQLPGYLINVTGSGRRNQVSCDNTAARPGGRVTNVTCTRATQAAPSTAGPPSG